MLYQKNFLIKKDNILSFLILSILIINFINVINVEFVEWLSDQYYIKPMMLPLIAVKQLPVSENP